jgi:hypothetical protein
MGPGTPCTVLVPELCFLRKEKAGISFIQVTLLLSLRSRLEATVYVANVRRPLQHKSCLHSPRPDVFQDEDLPKQICHIDEQQQSLQHLPFETSVLQSRERELHALSLKLG